MATLFLVCAVLGGGALLLQLAASLLGLEHGDVEVEHELGGELSGGLNLLSVRSLVAAVAFFGIAGRGALAAGLGVVPATAVGVGAGAAAAVAVAAVMRLMRRFDSDGVVHMEGAVGRPARVHVGLSEDRARPGKVMLTLQDRLVEVPAVSLDGDLPTGTEVTVVGLADGGTLEVVRTPEPGV